MIQTLCNLSIPWYTQFPVTGPAAGASDSDTEGWGGGVDGAPGARVPKRAQPDQNQRPPINDE